MVAGAAGRHAASRHAGTQSAPAGEQWGARGSRPAAAARGAARRWRARCSPLRLAVTLLADDGAKWEAVGGGATVNEALAFAVASAPAGGRKWRPVYWHELYGD